MTVEQVNKFIKEIKEKKIHLQRMRILGGEPLLHPKLGEFILALFYELIVPGNLKKIEIVTNGIIDGPEALRDIMEDKRIKKAFQKQIIKFKKSSKGKELNFKWILAAPVDLGYESCICTRPYICGINLNMYGYWPEGTCGAIARLFCRNDYSRQSFPKHFSKTWPDIEQDLCKYCGNGCKELKKMKTGPVSESYKKAIGHWTSGRGCDFKRY